MPSIITEEIIATIDTQGDTGTPTRVKIEAKRSGGPITEQFTVRAQICDDGVFGDATNATLAVDTGFGTVVATNSATKDLDLASMTAGATGVLTISSVVVDGETVTLGSRVYEFDHDGSTTGDNIVADISSYATASQGTLTMDTQPTALDSFEIDGRAFTFVADGDEGQLGEISRGADLAAAKVNLVAAIMGTDGVHTAHTTVSAAAFSGNDCVLTAITKGVAGDSISTTENFTAVGNVFDAGTLGTTTAGVDCTAANAVTALVAAITGDGSAEVTAADGTGDTVDVTAVVTGVAGNSVVSTETMANGSFGGATLSGGTVISEIFVNVTDASAETVTLRLGSPAVSGLAANYSLATIDITHAAP